MLWWHTQGDTRVPVLIAQDNFVQYMIVAIILPGSFKEGTIPYQYLRVCDQMARQSKHRAYLGALIVGVHMPRMIYVLGSFLVSLCFANVKKNNVSVAPNRVYLRVHHELSTREEIPLDN
jgi:hypothetical protein